MAIENTDNKLSSEEMTDYRQYTFAKLDPEFKVKWLAELRNPKNLKGEGCYADVCIHTGKVYYCALGIALKTDFNFVPDVVHTVKFQFFADKRISTNYAEEQGNVSLWDIIVLLNDGGLSFSEIADWLEAKV